MNKRPIASMLMLMCLAGLAKADDKPKVSVVDKQGEKTFFDKHGIAAINFRPDNIEVMDKNGNSTVFSKQDVALIILSDNDSGVNLVTESGVTVTVKATNERIRVMNAECAEWRLLDVSGLTVMSGKCERAVENIDISGIPAGIYIFAVANNIIKFIKR